MACLRNLAIGVLGRAGPGNLAAALRFHSRDPHRPLATLGSGSATGAAAGASARILRSLPDQDDVTDQRGARNGQPDKTPVLSGMEASNGQAGTSTRPGQ